MRIEELKDSWDKMHQEGLSPHKVDDVKLIIEKGTTKLIAEINKKLLKGLLVLVVATIVSALGTISFYYRYDSLKHPWIDLELLFPIQILPFVLFFILFLSGFFQYKLVNQSFTADTVKDFISITLSKIKKYNTLFSVIISGLLFLTYSALLNYFIRPEAPMGYIIISVAGLILTLISHKVNIRYWNHNMRGFMDDLTSYLNELN